MLAPVILAGEVATCGTIELEILFSARSRSDLIRTRATRSRAFRLVPTTQPDFDRAADVMAELARRGQHRAVKLPDLLIAAVAERANLTIFHYDDDFEAIASITPPSQHNGSSLAARLIDQIGVLDARISPSHLALRDLRVPTHHQVGEPWFTSAH